MQPPADECGVVERGAAPLERLGGQRPHEQVLRPVVFIQLCQQRDPEAVLVRDELVELGTIGRADALQEAVHQRAIDVRIGEEQPARFVQRAAVVQAR